MFNVVAVLACPNLLDTVHTSVPSAIISVALVCLNEWSVTYGKSVLLMNFANQSVTVSGKIGVPFQVLCLSVYNPSGLLAA